MARSRPRNNVRTRRSRRWSATPSGIDRRRRSGHVAGREGAGSVVPRRSNKSRALDVGQPIHRPSGRVVAHPRDVSRAVRYTRGSRSRR